MTSAVKMERLRQNDPRMTDLDLWLNGDANLEALTQAFQENKTLHSVSVLYTCQSNMLRESRERTGARPQRPRQNRGMQHQHHTSETTTTIMTPTTAAATATASNKHVLLGLVEALGSIPSLRKVSITAPTSRRCSFPVKAVSTLLTSARQCTKLSVGRMIVSTTTEAAEFDELAAALQNHPCLEDVYLNGSILFGGAQCIPRAQENLVHALAAIPTLNTVTLNGTGGAANFASGSSSTLSLDSVRLLCQSRSLTKLLLYDFPLSDDHLVAIEQACSANANAMNNHDKPLQQLREIRLSACILGSRGVEALSNIVSSSANCQTTRQKNSSSLQVLHVWIKEFTVDRTRDKVTTHLLRLAAALQGSRIRDFRFLAGAESQQQMAAACHPISSSLVQTAFSQMIHYNYQLEACSILCCSQVCQTDISFYLKLNKLGRRRLLCGQISMVVAPEQQAPHSKRRFRRRKVQKDDWVDVLIDARHDLSCIYYFMSMNPSLCHVS